MTAGTIGTVIDPDTVFRWSLYLLLALWPLAVYWCARLFGLSRWTAAGAAAVAPFLVVVRPASATRTRRTSGRATACGPSCGPSWTLPLAWGFTYRSLRSLRAIFPAVLFIMLTVALHFETGYLAFVPLVVWPFLMPSDLKRRLLRAVAIGAGALAASLWVIYPLWPNGTGRRRTRSCTGRRWRTATAHRTVLWWLISGTALRLPAHLPGRHDPGAAWASWSASPAGARSLAGRALVTIWVVTLLMTFGRTTWGVLYKVVPGSSDIFIRRFEMGVQLSGILLAGVAIVTIGRFVVNEVAHLLPEDRRGWARHPTGSGLVAGLCIVALVIGLSPAWWNIGTYDHHNATNVSLQAQADAQEGPQIDQLIDYVKAHPRGRVYAGSPTNWGTDFTVGAVPVFKYLESKDVDEVGYTLRTASLMTDPEYFFDDTNPGDYPLFGIGYLILPEAMASPVAADKVGCSGEYCLYSLPESGYIHVYDTTGVLEANRADVGTKSETLLESPLHQRGPRPRRSPSTGPRPPPLPRPTRPRCSGRPDTSCTSRPTWRTDRRRPSSPPGDGPPWC